MKNLIEETFRGAKTTATAWTQYVNCEITFEQFVIEGIKALPADYSMFEVKATIEFFEQNKNNMSTGSDSMIEAITGIDNLLARFDEEETDELYDELETLWEDIFA